MNNQVVSEIEIESLVAWAKVSCRQFMLGEVPPNFEHHRDFRMENGVVLKKEVNKNIIEGDVSYGEHLFTCVITKFGNEATGWWACVTDPTEPDEILFSTSDTITNGGEQ